MRLIPHRDDDLNMSATWLLLLVPNISVPAVIWPVFASFSQRLSVSSERLSPSCSECSCEASLWGSPGQMALSQPNTKDHIDTTIQLAYTFPTFPIKIVDILHPSER